MGSQTEAMKHQLSVTLGEEAARLAVSAYHRPHGIMSEEGPGLMTLGGSSVLQRGRRFGAMSCR